METDLNSIIVTIGYTITIFGGLSTLAVGHYYSKKGSGKKRLTQAEFNRGIILIAITSFFSVAGVVGAILLKDFLDPEPISVTEITVISFLCLVLPPLFIIGGFISEFRRKGWVEKEK